MKRGRPQAKDVDDREVLRVILREGGQPVVQPKGPPRPQAVSWDVVAAMPYPAKVMRAKLSTLVRRGLIDGCDCGCRGDFVLTEKGDALLAGS